ncbi:TfoX/Sxy family protein [Candidatus Babeliales bacterium]|nr:TfoX/Sxy family protein [Candidatus Babeliales bacterium]
MNNNGFVDYVLDALSPHGNIKARKMFGGYGIYKNDLCFALIINDVLFFKVDKGDEKRFEEYGSQPFSYENKQGKKVIMSYWQLPVDILENPAKLAMWIDKSFYAAQQTKKPKRTAPAKKLNQKKK